MAYSIPVPEQNLQALFLQCLPSTPKAFELSFGSGRMTIRGRLRKLGIFIPFRVELEPSASVPAEAAVALDWRIRCIRPFLARWTLPAEFCGQARAAGLESQAGVVRIKLESLLEGLPAWQRLPFSLRRTLRLQHWWMPNKGRGLFLVFSKDTETQQFPSEVPGYEDTQVQDEARLGS